MKLKTIKKRYGPATKFIRKWKKRGRKLLPWQMAYHNILTRVMSYNKRDRGTYLGIKCFVTPADLKKLFYFDKAYLLKQPSVDRYPNPDGHYIVGNIRWIEMSKNRRAHGLCHPTREKIYLEGKKLVVDFLKRNNWYGRFHNAFIEKLRRDFSGIKNKKPVV